MPILPFTSAPQNETFRYKSNKMCIRPTWKKLKNWWKTPKKNKLGGAIFHVLGWEDLILIVRILVLPNVIYRFNANSVKTPADYYANLVKLIQKFVWRDRRLETVNPTLKSKVGRARLPDLDLLESYDNQECDYKREEEVWYWRNNGQQVNWKNIEPHDWPTGIQWVSLHKVVWTVQGHRHGIFKKQSWNNGKSRCKRWTSDFPGGMVDKDPAASAGTRALSLVWEDAT